MLDLKTINTAIRLGDKVVPPMGTWISYSIVGRGGVVYKYRREVTVLQALGAGVGLRGPDLRSFFDNEVVQDEVEMFVPLHEFMQLDYAVEELPEDCPPFEEWFRWTADYGWS